MLRRLPHLWPERGADSERGGTIRCDNEAHCDSTNCTSTSTLSGSCKIGFLDPGSSCNPSTRDIMVCEAWIDCDTAKPACFQCHTATIVHNGSISCNSLWGRLECAPGSGSYQYVAWANDVTGVSTFCQTCNNGCSEECLATLTGCNQMAVYGSCCITLP